MPRPSFGTAASSDRVAKVLRPSAEASLPLVVASHNYKQMNDLSKDAASHYAVDEAGAGQRADNILLRILKRVQKRKI